MRRVFHLAEADAWRRFAEEPHEPCWSPPSLAREGFVHLSFAEQLGGTLDAHFAAHDALVLLELEPALLVDALCLEPSRGGALFPHLYRAPRRAEFVGRWPLERAPGWRLPRLAAERGDDRPRGAPPFAG